MAPTRTIATIRRAVMENMRLENQDVDGTHGTHVVRGILNTLERYRGKDLEFNRDETSFTVDANSDVDRYIHRTIRPLPNGVFVEDADGLTYLPVPWVEYSSTYFQIKSTISTDTNTVMEEWSWFKDRLYWWPRLAVGTVVRVLRIVGPPEYSAHYEGGGWVFKRTDEKVTYDTADPTTDVVPSAFEDEADPLWLDKAHQLVTYGTVADLYQTVYKAEDGKGLLTDDFRDMEIKELHRLRGEKMDREGPRRTRGHL